METYKFVELDNGDILLQKIIIDNTSYTIINNDNGDKLLKKITNVNITNIKDIKEYDFKKSFITECLINKIQFNKLKYRSILEQLAIRSLYASEQIYNIINDGVKIIKNTKVNIKTIKKEDEGFYYLDNIGISVQGVDSNKCLLEIIYQAVRSRTASE
jgi:hypothetical protein